MNQIRCPLSRSAEIYQDQPALVTSKKLLTLGILDRLVHLTAVNLTKKGIQRGTKVAIMGSNNSEYLILVIAIVRIGAVVCPISDRFPQKTIAELLRQINCERVILVNHTQKVFALPGTRLFLAEELVPDLVGRKTFRAQPMVSFENPAAIVFTSGTSATPKAALLSYGNFYFNALGANERIPFNENHRWLLTLPFYHVGGLGILFRAIVGGGCVVMADKETSIGEAVRNHEVTHLSLVPTQLYRLFKDGSFKFTGVPPIVLTGGGPVSDELLQKCREVNLNLFHTYGLTEMASQVTTGKCERGSHCGSLLRYRELRIAPDGEILVRGKTLFLGYIKDGSVELPIDDEGWFHTGDMGELDSDGFLTVRGRKDSMFISGGENIHPEEIELWLMKIKGIEKALVVGILDEEFGRGPAAFVKFSSGVILSESEIMADLEKSLPRFKIPRIYFDWPEHLDRGALKLPRLEFLNLARELATNRLKQTQEASS